MKNQLMLIAVLMQICVCVFAKTMSSPIIPGYSLLPIEQVLSEEAKARMEKDGRILSSAFYDTDYCYYFPDNPLFQNKTLSIPCFKSGMCLIVFPVDTETKNKAVELDISHKVLSDEELTDEIFSALKNDISDDLPFLLNVDRRLDYVTYNKTPKPEWKTLEGCIKIQNMVFDTFILTDNPNGIKGIRSIVSIVEPFNQEEKKTKELSFVMFSHYLITDKGDFSLATAEAERFINYMVFYQLAVNAIKQVEFDNAKKYLNGLPEDSKEYKHLMKTLKLIEEEEMKHSILEQG